jgi:Arylsulfotransferase (ASST)
MSDIKKYISLLALLALVMFPGCTSGDDDDDGGANAGAASVLITDVYQNTLMPLGCVLKFNSSSAGYARVEFGQDGTFDKTWYIGEIEAGETRATVIGMHADTTYNLRVVVQTNGAEGFSNEIPFTAGSLPDDVPRLEVTALEATPEDGGYYFLPFFTPSIKYELDDGDTVNFTGGYILVIDSTGEPVFYKKFENGFIFDLEFDEQRNIYYTLESPLGAVPHIGVISLEGEELARYEPGTIGGHSYHHEINLTPEGNILTIGLEIQDMAPDDSRFPTSIPAGTFEDDETAAVIGDWMVEFTPDGEITWSWSSFDHFDPSLETYAGPVYGSLDSNFWFQYLHTPDSFDWTHANALVPDWDQGTMLMSFRHFSSIINIDIDSGDVLWEMGKNVDDFTLTSGEWFVRQHSPSILDNGNLLLYDNGYSTSVTAGMNISFPNDVRPYSRAVEYSVDWDTKTMEQVWEYRETPEFYSDAMGDVDMLESGNVLVTSSQEGDIYGEGQWARLILVSHEETPRKLWELKANGWSIYRSAWFPSIQPIPDWAAPEETTATTRVQ